MYYQPENPGNLNLFVKIQEDIDPRFKEAEAGDARDERLPAKCFSFKGQLPVP
ncbi:hypothetical protein F511_01643 [Dorcoceras hygrometricum]|nr:hypothetical protein F511_01643 [Dorcoceras hygrometricum]